MKEKKKRKNKRMKNGKQITGKRGRIKTDVREKNKEE